MTREEFIEILGKEGYSYKIEGDKVVVKNKGNVWLGGITSLPTGVEFRNGGDVLFYALTSLPPDVVFKNRGDVNLQSLTSLPPGVEFRNRWIVNLRSLIGGDFTKWNGNIEGIDSKRLLNKMIKDGVFER